MQVLSVHHYYGRVQSATWTTYKKCLRQSIIAVLTPKLGNIRFCLFLFCPSKISITSSLFVAFKERAFIDCKAESERNDIKYVNFSMSSKESFSWIAIKNWSQIPRQLTMSPSNLMNSNFDNFTPTSWNGVILWKVPWLEISSELNDGGGGVFFKHLSIFANNSKFKSSSYQISTSFFSDFYWGKMSILFWSISLTLSILSKSPFLSLLLFQSTLHFRIKRYRFQLRWDSNLSWKGRCWNISQFFCKYSSQS